MYYEFNSVNQIWLKHKETIELYCEIELDGQPDLAANCVSETYLALLEAVNDELGIIEPRRWIMTTAHNIICLATEKPSSSLVSNCKNELNDLFLNKLSSGYRDILIKRYRKRLPVNAIAKDYGITEACMIQRLRRAKEKYFSVIDNSRPEKVVSNLPSSPLNDNDVMYRIGGKCIVDVTKRFFCTDDFDKKKRNCGSKAWRVIIQLIEAARNNQYVSTTDICHVYYQDKKTDEWSSKMCSPRAGTIISNINKIAGDKIIINKKRKGYKLAYTPKLIQNIESA